MLCGAIAGWGQAWRSPALQKSYDVVVIGAVAMGWPRPISSCASTAYAVLR